MKYFILMILLFVAVMQDGCKKDSMCNCFESTGSNSTESRTISPFTQIELYNNIDLILHTDTFYHLSVTAGSHLLDGVKTEVEGGVLKLRNKNRCNWLRSFKNTFVVDVWVKALDQITIYDASGNIDFADTLTLQKNNFTNDSMNFILNSWSSTGDYHLKLNCNAATLALHTGAADIYAQGHVGVNYVYSVGYGKMDLLEVNSDDIYVTEGGTNDLYIKANHRIGAELTYLGNIYYRGNPTQVDEKYTNSGRLIHIN